MRRFGIEVEFKGSQPDGINALNAAGLACRSHGYRGHDEFSWVMKADGSVPGGGELVSPPLDFDSPDDREQVTRAIKALGDSGARTYTKAGIHIHVEARDLNPDQIAAVCRNFVKFEDVIYRIASSGWRTIRPEAYRYCKPLLRTQAEAIAKSRTDVALQRAYRQGSLGSPRYYGINLESFWLRGTIEFRVFNSSMNPQRIQAYIAMCVALVEDARRGNKRSINKAYKLGGMLAGTTNPKNAYHRFQQVLRYEAGMSLEDMKLLNRCWKDSQPQAPIGAY